MTPKQTITKLAIEPDFDFVLVAISSSLNDYSLCWALNRFLNVSLERTEDLIAEIDPSKDKGAFALFKCEECDYVSGLSLISNKSDKGYLVKALNNIDFFLLIHGELFEEEEQKIISTIKGIDGVLLSFKLTKELLPDNQRKKFFSVFTTL